MNGEATKQKGGVDGELTKSQFDFAQTAIRAAGLRDAPAIAALVNRAYRGAESYRGWTTEAGFLSGQRVDASFVMSEIAKPDGAFFLAMCGERIVGSVQAKLLPNGDGYLGMLAVEPRLQAAGVGRKLIDVCEAHARERWAAPGMRLSVISIRKELIAYYERRGYAATGEIEAFPYEVVGFDNASSPDLQLSIYRKVL